MEYTFKNSVWDKVQTIVLNQYNLTLQSAGREDVIPYANITSVRLSKVNGKQYQLTIIPENHPDIVVTNKYFLPDGSPEDRSRQYATFVRVLHYHLKDKSSTQYLTGFSLKLLMQWMIGCGFIAFFISFISEFLRISMMNPFFQGIILTAAFVTIMFVVNKGRLPKHYSPTDIPLQFLP